MLQKQNGAMRKIVAAVSQIDNRVKQGLALRNKSNSDHKRSLNGRRREDPRFMKDMPADPSKVKDWNSKPWYYCATCGCWSTTHSTNGFTHNGKEIAKHDGSSPRKKCDNQQSSSLQSTPSSKKAKASKGPVTGLQSLQAELKTQNSSPLCDLVQATAAGAQ
jgi:hypothetical protein